MPSTLHSPSIQGYARLNGSGLLPVPEFAMDQPPSRFVAPGSKVEFQSELYLTRRSLKQRRISRTCNASCLRRSDLRIGIVELGCIENVECFGSKLQVPRFVCSQWK